MGRKRKNIVLPRLVNGEDLDKAAWVEWKLRDPRTQELKRFRIYEGILNATSVAERKRVADMIIEDITNRLADGWNPFEAEKVSYKDLLTEQRIIARWGGATTAPATVCYYLSSFLGWKKPSIIPHSFQTYASKLRIFKEWCQRNDRDKHPALIQQEDIVNFIVTMAEQCHWSRRTVTKYQQILHHFWAWLIQEKVCEENPVRGIPSVGVQRDDAAKPIPPRIRKVLLQYMREHDPQLMLACMLEYYCAIRPNEMRLLRLSEIDLQHHCIRIPCTIAKNRTTQSVDLPAQMYDELVAMELDAYPPTFYLFGKCGEPGPECLGKNTLRWRFDAIRDALGISKVYKFYSFKHTGGVELVNAGIDTWQLQRHFRHSSVATTEAYIRRNFSPNNDLLRNQFPDL